MKICDFQPVTCCILETVQDSYYWTLATTTILWPLYRTTCISQHSQLRTGGFCWSEVLLHECPCSRQLVHLDLVEDARVLLSSVNCTICILLNTNRKLYTDLPNNDIANDFEWLLKFIWDMWNPLRPVSWKIHYFITVAVLQTGMTVWWTVIVNGYID